MARPRNIANRDAACARPCARRRRSPVRLEMENTAPAKVSVRLELEGEELHAFENFRRRQSVIPTVTAAAHQLLRLGLQAEHAA
jgi:hypothetical protein